MYPTQLQRLGLVYDVNSLRRWLGQYRVWVMEHWSPFYEQPCGWVLMMMHTSEIDAYTTAYLRGALEQDEDPFSGRGLIAMRFFRDADASAIRSAGSNGASDSPNRQTVPVDQQIQALVDAYLNRECLDCIEPSEYVEKER